MSHPSFADWFFNKHRVLPQEPREWVGLSPCARALWLTRWLEEIDRPCFFVFPSGHEAREFLEDLKFFNPHFSRGYYLPPYEFDFHKNVVANQETIVERNLFLHHLYFPKKGDVFVTTVRSLFQKIPAPEQIRKHLLTLRINEEIERTDLIKILKRSGYQPQPNCQDPGVYTLRGGVLDLFSPLYPHPVRVLFYGDFIEEIRFFDPATQRTLSQTNSIDVLPVGMSVLPDSEDITEWGARIKEALDHIGVSKSERDEIIGSLEHYHLRSEESFLFPLWTSTVFLGEVTRGFELCIAEKDRLVEDLTQEIQPHFVKHYEHYLKERRPIGTFAELFASQDEVVSFVERPDSRRFEMIGSRSESPQTQCESVMFSGGIDKNAAVLRDWLDEGYQIHVIASTQVHLDKTKFLLENHGLKSIYHSQDKVPFEVLRGSHSSVLQMWIGTLSESVRIAEIKTVLLREQELFGIKKKKSKVHKAFDSQEAVLSSFKTLRVGDFVVHRDHGIGKYLGLKSIEVQGTKSEFIHLEYKEGDKLYLPIYRLNLLQKYASQEAGHVVVDKLGGDRFEKAKLKARRAARELASELLTLQAQRRLIQLPPFGEPPEAFSEMEQRFPYEETPDQQKAIDDILSDFKKPYPMDRLVCGDVGYGKTEVAIRAAYRCLLEGSQVAVLVPTTVLAFQHFETFKKRLAETGARIEMISRLRSSKEIKRIFDDLKQGKIDILIGTHRVLSADIHFKTLGLLIIDEEHRFGVTHKERLKKMGAGIHVLTLTATPIPRTLNMAMMGIKDISLITTPPPDRLAVRTFVCKRGDEILVEAIQNELKRDGQVFFVHNRIESIYRVAEELQTLLPNLKFQVVHGQMDGETLERKMLEFYEGLFDCLLTTTIIESGLDVSRANTIIIDDADHLGLAQLYQLRGRVGRSDRRAYCYLLTPPESKLTTEAKQRLQVIQRYSDLGAGFSVASHDLEIRGAGDLLGKDQSGQVSAIGIDLYFELLEEAIRELRGQPRTFEIEPEISVPIATYFPDEYLPDISERISLYRRMSQVEKEDTIAEIEEEIRDRFGAPPDEVVHLIQLMRLKFHLKKLGVIKLSMGPKRTSLQFSEHTPVHPKKVIELVQKNPKLYSITPDQKLVFAHEQKDLGLLVHQISFLESTLIA